MKNRFEVIVSLAGIICFLGVLLYKRYMQQEPAPNYFNFVIPLGNLRKNATTPEQLDWDFDAAGRLCFIIPILRLLSSFGAVSRLFFGLLAILPIFWDVYATGVIIFYMFSALGVLLFFGKYQVLKEDANEIPEATFDSFLNGVYVCFNLFNGESWDLLMEAGVKATGLWYMSVYFVIQMVILNMLFQDLITGIIIDASRNLSDLFEDSDSAKVDAFAFWERLTATRNDVVANGQDGNNDDDDADDQSPNNGKLSNAINRALTSMDLDNLRSRSSSTASTPRTHANDLPTSPPSDGNTVQQELSSPRTLAAAATTLPRSTTSERESKSSLI